MVSLAATIAFLRAHGLDALVDAYGVHMLSFAGATGQSFGRRATQGPPSTASILRNWPPQRSGQTPAGSTEWGISQRRRVVPGEGSPLRTLLIEERCAAARFLPQRPAEHRADRFIVTTSPGTPIHGRASPTLTASIAATQLHRGRRAGRCNPFSPVATERMLDLAASMRVRVGVPLRFARVQPAISPTIGSRKSGFPTASFRGFTAGAPHLRHRRRPALQHGRPRQRPCSSQDQGGARDSCRPVDSARRRCKAKILIRLDPQ